MENMVNAWIWTTITATDSWQINNPGIAFTISPHWPRLTQGCKLYLFIQHNFFSLIIFNFKGKFFSVIIYYLIDLKGN